MNYELLLFNALKKAEPNYLDKYIFREFKIAEKEYYSKGEFFNGCLTILKKWERSIDESYEIALSQLLEKENKIYLASGTEEQKARALKQLEREKQTTLKENFATPIFTEAKSFIGGVKLADIEKLVQAMGAALQLAEIENETLPPQQTETKTDKPKAPLLGLFCALINKIGIDKKEETESATVYCKRICIKYKLPYTDRVRQNYNVNETKKIIQ